MEASASKKGQSIYYAFIGAVFTTYWSAYMVWIVPIPLLSIYCILCVNQQLILHEWAKVYQNCKLSIAIRAHKKSGQKIFRSRTFLFMAGPLFKCLLRACPMKPTITYCCFHHHQVFCRSSNSITYLIQSCPLQTSQPHLFFSVTTCIVSQLWPGTHRAEDSLWASQVLFTNWFPNIERNSL